MTMSIQDAIDALSLCGAADYPAWVDAPGMPGVRFFVRSTHSAAACQAADEHPAPLFEEEDPADQFARVGKILAAGVLVDWAGIEDEAGRPVSRYRAADILSDPHYRVLQHAREKMIQARPPAERALRADPEAEYVDMARLLAENILLGWEDLDDENGNPLPFSSSVALALLSDPEMRALQVAVRYAAYKVDGIGDEPASSADAGIPKSEPA